MTTFFAVRWDDLMIRFRIDPRRQVVGSWELSKYSIDSDRYEIQNVDHRGFRPQWLEFDRGSGLKVRRELEGFRLDFEYHFEGEEIILTRTSPKYLYRGTVNRKDDSTLEFVVGGERFVSKARSEPFPELLSVEEFYESLEIELHARRFCRKLYQWNEQHLTRAGSYLTSLEETLRLRGIAAEIAESCEESFRIEYARNDRKWSCTLAPRTDYRLRSFFADQTGIVRWDDVETATADSDPVD